MSEKRPADEAAPPAAPAVRHVPVDKNLRALADSLECIREEVNELVAMLLDARMDVPSEAYDRAIVKLFAAEQTLHLAQDDASASITSEK